MLVSRFGHKMVTVDGLCTTFRRRVLPTHGEGSQTALSILRNFHAAALDFHADAGRVSEDIQFFNFYEN